MLRRFTTVLAALAITVSGFAQMLPADSIASGGKNTAPKSTDFRWKQTALPVALIGVGALGLAPTVFKDGSEQLTHQIIGVRSPKHALRFDDYIQYVPMTGALFLGSAGIKAKHRFWERTLILGTSYAALGVLTKGAKLCINEERPDGSDNESFPSGHVGRAFMGAELVRIEYGKWYGLGAYSVALTVGFMRMYNGKHHFHDVVAGAGVGILSARIGEWSGSLWQKALSRKKRKAVGVAFTPIVSPVQGGHYGFHFACHF